MEWKTLLCEDRIRQYSKAGSGDLRSEYEKDYHRIIGSASFRRLQDKTQVFPLDQSDFIRTRLTHSLEVSSLSKSLAQNVGRSITKVIKDPGFAQEHQADLCDILQCAGLLHDIGNPPFGHFGETIIRNFFKEQLSQITVRLPGQDEERALSAILSPQMQADFTNFEGNTQALRVVTKLHYLVDEHGMNLTKALLATIIKYPVSSLEIEPKGPIHAHKMGYFHADEAVFQDIEESTGLHGKRHPLTFLLEAGDDIAYHTADIEDAFKKGFISYEQLYQELSAGKIAGAERNDYDYLVDSLKRKYDRAVQQGKEHPDDYAIQNWIITVQGVLIRAATDAFTAHYQEIMEGTFETELLEGTDAGRLSDLLGDICYRYVFTSKPIYMIEISAEQILTYLLERFVHAIIYYDTPTKISPVDERLISLISENYKTIYHIYAKDCGEEEKLYLRLLLVTDYVCGMTDSFAQDLYWKLNGRI